MPLLMLGVAASDAAAQIIETVAGGGIGDGGLATAAMVSLPGGVAVDSFGNFYFADAQRIRKVVIATGVISTAAGTGAASYNGDNIPATRAALSYPSGITLDPSGNLYIVDRANQRIRKVAAETGVITTVAGTGSAGYNGDNVTATDATLNLTGGYTYGSAGTGIAVDSSGNAHTGTLVNSPVWTATPICTPPCRADFKLTPHVLGCMVPPPEGMGWLG